MYDSNAPRADGLCRPAHERRGPAHDGKRGAGFVRRRFFGKRARYLPGKKVLEAQAAEMVGKTAENCGLPTISILTPLYNTPENYLREFLDSFVNQTAPNGQLCLADASDDAHPEVERVVRE